MADEYHELERNRVKSQYFAEKRVEELQLELEQAKRKSALWEELAKRPFSEVMQDWMDSLI